MNCTDHKLTSDASIYIGPTRIFFRRFFATYCDRAHRIRVWFRPIPRSWSAPDLAGHHRPVVCAPADVHNNNDDDGNVNDDDCDNGGAAPGSNYARLPQHGLLHADNNVRHGSGEHRPLPRFLGHVLIPHINSPD